MNSSIHNNNWEFWSSWWWSLDWFDSIWSPNAHDADVSICLASIDVNCWHATTSVSFELLYSRPFLECHINLSCSVQISEFVYNIQYSNWVRDDNPRYALAVKKGLYIKSPLSRSYKDHSLFSISQQTGFPKQIKESISFSDLRLWLVWLHPMTGKRIPYLFQRWSLVRASQCRADTRCAIFLLNFPKQSQFLWCHCYIFINRRIYVTHICQGLRWVSC